MDIRNKSIIICSILRDAERGLRRNIPAIKKIAKEFKDYKIIIFENNSLDKTKELLAQWAKEDSEHVFVTMSDSDPTKTTPSKISKVGVNRYFSHKRIDKMANLRNQYMEYIDERGWTADLLMVVDMDVEQIFAEPILDGLKFDREWDAIATYGYGIKSGFKRCYYDTYALTKWEDRDKAQTEQIIFGSNRSLDSVKCTDEWVRVASAFCGLAIYKFESVKGLRYIALDNNDEHVEVRCEHFSIYKQMRERGYDKFYIVPSMQLKYQGFTKEVIIRRLRLMLQNFVSREVN